MTAIDATVNRCACGAEIGRWSTRCNDCRVKNIVATAEVVEPSGPLNIVDSDTFFFDLDEASEYNAGQYAHPCDEVPLHVHRTDREAEELAERVIEDMCEEAHEDAQDQVVGRAELVAAFKDALDKFNDAQTSCSWMPRVREVFVIPASGMSAETAETPQSGSGPQDRQPGPSGDAQRQS